MFEKILKTLTPNKKTHRFSNNSPIASDYNVWNKTWSLT